MLAAISNEIWAIVSGSKFGAEENTCPLINMLPNWINSFSRVEKIFCIIHVFGLVNYKSNELV